MIAGLTMYRRHSYDWQGKTITNIDCPFCGEMVKADLFAIAWGGQRCKCGALHTERGTVKPKIEPKMDKTEMNSDIIDLSWMWHCSENPSNIIDYSKLNTDTTLSKTANFAASMGFRSALRRLEELQLITLADIDRHPNDEDQKKWDELFKLH